MESARKAAKRAAAGAPSASALLQGAYVETAGQEGRATVCIAVLETTEAGTYLHAANIGDSGYWVLRVRGEGTGARLAIAQRSRPLSHSFNCPYQLGVLNGVELNTPVDADVYSAVELRTGDLVNMILVLPSRLSRVSLGHGLTVPSSGPGCHGWLDRRLVSTRYTYARGKGSWPGQSDTASFLLPFVCEFPTFYESMGALRKQLP